MSTAPQLLFPTIATHAPGSKVFFSSSRRVRFWDGDFEMVATMAGKKNRDEPSDGAREPKQATLSHCNVTLPHCHTALWHCDTVKLWHSHTAVSHCLIVTLWRCDTATLPHCTLTVWGFHFVTQRSLSATPQRASQWIDWGALLTQKYDLRTSNRTEIFSSRQYNGDREICCQRELLEQRVFHETQLRSWN